MGRRKLPSVPSQQSSPSSSPYFVQRQSPQIPGRRVAGAAASSSERDLSQSIFNISHVPPLAARVLSEGTLLHGQTPGSSQASHSWEMFPDAPTQQQYLASAISAGYLPRDAAFELSGMPSASAGDGSSLAPRSQTGLAAVSETDHLRFRQARAGGVKSAKDDIDQSSAASLSHKYQQQQIEDRQLSNFTQSGWPYFVAGNDDQFMEKGHFQTSGKDEALQQQQAQALQRDFANRIGDRWNSFLAHELAQEHNFRQSVSAGPSPIVTRRTQPNRAFSIGVIDDNSQAHISSSSVIDVSTLAALRRGKMPITLARVLLKQELKEALKRRRQQLEACEIEANQREYTIQQAVRHPHAYGPSLLRSHAHESDAVVKCSLPPELVANVHILLHRPPPPGSAITVGTQKFAPVKAASPGRQRRDEFTAAEEAVLSGVSAGNAYKVPQWQKTTVGVGTSNGEDPSVRNLDDAQVTPDHRSLQTSFPEVPLPSADVDYRNLSALSYAFPMGAQQFQYSQTGMVIGGPSATYPVSSGTPRSAPLGRRRMLPGEPRPEKGILKDGSRDGKGELRQQAFFTLPYQTSKFDSQRPESSFSTATTLISGLATDSAYRSRASGGLGSPPDYSSHFSSSLSPRRTVKAFREIETQTATRGVLENGSKVSPSESGGARADPRVAGLFGPGHYSASQAVAGPSSGTTVGFSGKLENGSMKPEMVAAEKLAYSHMASFAQSRAGELRSLQELQQELMLQHEHNQTLLQLSQYRQTIQPEIGYRRASHEKQTRKLKGEGKQPAWRSDIYGESTACEHKQFEPGMAPNKHGLKSDGGEGCDSRSFAANTRDSPVRGVEQGFSFINNAEETPIKQYRRRKDSKKRADRQRRVDYLSDDEDFNASEIRKSRVRREIDKRRRHLTSADSASAPPPSYSNGGIDDAMELDGYGVFPQDHMLGGNGRLPFPYYGEDENSAAGGGGNGLHSSDSSNATDAVTNNFSDRLTGAGQRYFSPGHAWNLNGLTAASAYTPFYGSLPRDLEKSAGFYDTSPTSGRPYDSRLSRRTPLKHSTPGAAGSGGLGRSVEALNRPSRPTIVHSRSFTERPLSDNDQNTASYRSANKRMIDTYRSDMPGYESYTGSLPRYGATYDAAGQMLGSYGSTSVGPHHRHRSADGVLDAGNYVSEFYGTPSLRDAAFTAGYGGYPEPLSRSMPSLNQPGAYDLIQFPRLNQTGAYRGLATSLPRQYDSSRNRYSRSGRSHGSSSSRNYRDYPSSSYGVTGHVPSSYRYSDSIGRGETGYYPSVSTYGGQYYHPNTGLPATSTYRVPLESVGSAGLSSIPSVGRYTLPYVPGANYRRYPNTADDSYLFSTRRGMPGTVPTAPLNYGGPQIYDSRSLGAGVGAAQGGPSLLSHYANYLNSSYGFGPQPTIAQPMQPATSSFLGASHFDSYHPSNLRLGVSPYAPVDPTITPYSSAIGGNYPVPSSIASTAAYTPLLPTSIYSQQPLLADPYRFPPTSTSGMTPATARAYASTGDLSGRSHLYDDPAANYRNYRPHRSYSASRSLPTSAAASSYYYQPSLYAAPAFSTAGYYGGNYNPTGRPLARNLAGGFDGTGYGYGVDASGRSLLAGNYGVDGSQMGGLDGWYHPVVTSAYSYYPPTYHSSTGGVNTYNPAAYTTGPMNYKYSSSLPTKIDNIPAAQHYPAVPTALTDAYGRQVGVLPGLIQGVQPGTSLLDGSLSGGWQNPYIGNVMIPGAGTLPPSVMGGWGGYRGYQPPLGANLAYPSNSNPTDIDQLFSRKPPWTDSEQQQKPPMDDPPEWAQTGKDPPETEDKAVNQSLGRRLSGLGVRSTSVHDQQRISGGSRRQRILHPVKRILLTRDPKDKSIRSSGLGMKVIGGKLIQGSDGELGAFVSTIYPGGVADTMGEVKEGDQILEWNGVTLTGKSYEEVQQIIDSFHGEIEILIRSIQRNNGRRGNSTRNPNHVFSGEKHISNVDDFAGSPSYANENRNYGIVGSGLRSSRSDTTDRGYESGDNSSGYANDGIPMNAHGGSSYCIPEQRLMENQPHFTESNNVNTDMDYLSPICSISSRSLSPSSQSLHQRQEQQFQINQRSIKSKQKYLTGEIKVAVAFDESSKTLLVTIIRGRGLHSENRVGYPNPFVKVYLLPSSRPREEQKRRTKYIPGTTSPEWNQTVAYKDMEWERMSDLYLEFTVWDYDKHAHNHFLGRTSVTLADPRVFSRRARWYPLQPALEDIDETENEACNDEFSVVDHDDNRSNCSATSRGYGRTTLTNNIPRAQSEGSGFMTGMTGLSNQMTNVGSLDRDHQILVPMESNSLNIQAHRPLLIDRSDPDFAMVYW